MIWTFVIILLLIGAWSTLIILLDSRKVLEKYKMSRIWGIFLMWRTEKGKDLIDRMAGPKRFWNAFAIIGLTMIYFGMVSMFLLILASTLTVLLFGFSETVSAEKVFVLPGLNPYVPLVYGVIALVFAVVVHEFSHGILAKANGIKVQSLGLLFMVVPVGAFMEPDEDQVKRSSRLKRIKMFASGPIINFIFAFIFFILFSSVMMGSISAPQDPFIVTNVFDGSSIERTSDDIECLYEINGTKISSFEDINDYGASEPGSWIKVKISIDGKEDMVPAIAGVMVYSVTDDSPAKKAGIEKGAIILSIDNNTMNSKAILTDFLDGTNFGDNITIVFMRPLKNETGDLVLNRTPPIWLKDSLTLGSDSLFPVYEIMTMNVVLDDKYDYIPINSLKDKGFLGIGSSYLGIGGIGSNELLASIKSPIASADSPMDALNNAMYMTFVLPLSTTIVPFHHPLTSVYEIQGPFSFVPDNIFWFIANCFFYLFWLNILLALFNALPAYPLDGGVIFKDSFVLIGLNFTSKERIEKLDRWAGKAAAFASITVFSLILITWLYPYLRLFLNGF